MAASPPRRKVLGPLGSARTVAARSTGLPTEVVAQAAKRLEGVALLVAVTSGLALLLHSLPGTREQFGTADSLAVRRVGQLIGVVTSVAILVAGRTGRLPKGRLVDLGQLYFVLLAATMSLSEAASPYGPTAFNHGVPLTVVPILVLPLLLPAAPRRAAVTGVVAALTLPLMLAVVPPLVGRPLPAPNVFVLATIPGLMAALMSFVGARVIYRIGGDLKRAQRLGSYQLETLLGKGGMGEVWRAQHAMLARTAAIKLIRGERAVIDAQARERFRHEAQAIAGLRSPHTIELYDFGVTEDGALYYVMELLDGLDLDVLVSRHGPVPAERAVYLLKQACHSLAEAHAEGLVHRDIKPANLFAARLGRDHDFAKVLDFGLAKREVLAHVDGAKLTVEGAIQGTPAYMAPEQILGQPLDGRADLYALGCVAWWLLTGGDVFVGTNANQVMFAHLQGDAEPPSACTDNPVPPELDAAILACLAKSPADRPADADALCALLDAIPLARPWSSARAHDWWAALPTQ